MLVVGNLSVGEIYRTLGDYRKARSSSRGSSSCSFPATSTTVRDRLACRRCARAAISHGRSPSWAIYGRACRRRGGLAAGRRVRAFVHHHSWLPRSGWRALARRESSGPRSRSSSRGLAASDRVPLLRPPIAADLGVAYARCGNIEEGLTHLHAAVDGAKSMGRMSRLPLMLVKCGGDPPARRRYATRPGSLPRRRCVWPCSKRSAATRSTPGICLPRLNWAPTGAERFYREALELATEIGMAPLAARCHAGLAIVYARMSRHDAAEDHLAQARTMFKSMGMRFFSSRLQGAMAEVV